MSAAPPVSPADPLAALRDLHGPPAPDFWPPAPGWIALAGLGVALGLVAAIRAARWWRAGRFRREALASLRALRARHAAGAADTEIAMELSALMRRVALARRPREEVAGLTGERWMASLESTLPGIGAAARTALLDAPYARRRPFDVARALAVAAVAALAHGDARTQSLHARLDRNPVHDDETVRLVVEAEGQAGGLELDFAPLERDFEVLGRSTSTHVSLGSGASSVRTEWTVELAPRRPGRLTIGPFRAGTMTGPAIELEVLPSSSSMASRADRDVFLEVEVAPREVYVQSQLVCVLRIYRAAEFLEATLSDFAPESAVTHRLGKDSTYSRRIDGRRYRVIERRFAVFPQTSGRLALPAFRLDARIAEPGAASTMGRLFGEGRRVRLGTRPVDVVVKPRPGGAAMPWLPATAVDLTAQWPEEPPRLVVGEPVTWTLRLGATGLAGEQLPPLDPPELEGVRVYPDQPSIATRTSADAVHGERVQRVALVPGAAGTLTIPEMRVRWWDVEADAPRTAVIPARTLPVAPAPVSTAPSRPVLAAVPAAPETSARAWQIASAALALAWLVTLGALVRVRGRRRGTGPRVGTPARESPPDAAAARRRTLDACGASDPRAARRALLDWAGLVWPGASPRDLIALAARVDDEPFGEAIMALDRALWSGRETAWNGRAMAALLPREIESRASPRSRAARGGLPSLHPA